MSTKENTIQNEKKFHKGAFYRNLLNLLNLSFIFISKYQVYLGPIHNLFILSKKNFVEFNHCYQYWKYLAMSEILSNTVCFKMKTLPALTKPYYY